MKERRGNWSNSVHFKMSTTHTDTLKISTYRLAPLRPPSPPVIATFFPISGRAKTNVVEDRQKKKNVRF